MKQQATSKPARRHHFVSQVYLKGFTVDGRKDTQLFVVSLEQRKTFSTVPANVAQERDFNRVDGLSPGELDNLLGRFEGTAGIAIERIAAAGSLDDQDAWLEVLNLAALFAVRHPARRETLRAAMERVAKLVGQMLVYDREGYERQMAAAAKAGFVDPNSGVTFDQMREFVTRGEYEIKVPTERHLDIEFRVFEEVLKTMVARRWTLIKASPSAGHFVTSDQPVFLVSTGPEPAHQARHLGHGLKRTALFLPLTRHLFAIGTFEGQANVVETDAVGVAELNAQVLANAYREVYAPTTDAAFALGEQLVTATGVLGALHSATK